jgi:hypothetical protein
MAARSRPFTPATNCLRWSSTTGPTPAGYPSPPGRATAGSAAPAGPGPTGHATRLSAWSSTTANRTGPLTTRRQRPRRRITPNTNTSTTTIISTHNHVDMAASLVGAGAVQADATAAHPSKQLGHRQATSWSRIDGRAPRRLAGTPAPRDLPADLGWPGSRPRVGPDGAEPFGPRPASPAPTTAPSTTRERTRAGVNRPDATTASRPVGMARPRSVCPAWVGNNASMAVPMRNGRRRAAGAGPMVRAFGDTRTCAQDGCTAQLSRYNPARRCALHQGWDRQKVTRPRIHQQGHGRG